MLAVTRAIKETNTITLSSSACNIMHFSNILNHYCFIFNNNTLDLDVKYFNQF